MNYPTSGITVDAAHSMKNGVTEYQGRDLKTGERLFYVNLGNQTTNIGEFLAIIEGQKFILENDFNPRVIYSDSLVALGWIQNKRTGSNKDNSEMRKAEVFLKAFQFDLDTIQLIHWDSKLWGENPADFGNKK